VYSATFIFPCMMEDGHRRPHYIYRCNKSVCSVAHLHTIALKDLIRGWVCVWFSSTSLALQVMAVELHLCLALPGITETDTVNYVSMCAYQSNCTKACISGGRIVLCLLVAFPMIVAKEVYPSFHSWCLVTVRGTYRMSSCNHGIQGMINKRPDCCNKSFMLIDKTYSSLSPSK
jgi:hypothetical protein